MGEVLHRVDSEEPEPVEFQDADHEPIFELVTRYLARESDSKKRGSGSPTSVPSPTINSVPFYFLRIYSPAIVNALQSVVTYYPGQHLLESVINISWPYPILVHHYEELREFKAICETKKPKELCVRERHASEHIGILLRFLDDNIMERVREEEARYAKGCFTFESLWLVYKPGRTVIQKDDHGVWSPFVVSSISGGTFHNPPGQWVVQGWNMVFEGEVFGRTRCTLNIGRFDGEKDWREDARFVDDRDNIEDDDLEEIIRDGETYWRLLRKQCRHYKGKTMKFPYNEVL